MRRLLLLAPFTLFACNNGGGTQTPIPKVDAGVGGDAGTPDTGTPSGVDFNMVGTTLADAQCGYFTRCIPEYYDVQQTDEATCKTDLALELSEVFEDAFTDLLEADRVTFEGGQLDLCVQAYQTADCVLGLPDDSPCDRVFQGVQAVAAPCFLNAECQPGNYCSRSAGLGNCGSCAALPGKGATCDPFTPCAAFSRCINVGQQAPDYRCIPIDAQEGGGCLTVDTGFCEGRLSCVINGQSATCQQPAGPGMTCANADPFDQPDCNLAAGYYCNGGMCADASWSDLTGQCGGAVLCRDGYCDPSASACTALPGAGMSCADVGACNDDAFCDGTNCRPLIADGQPCNSSGECSGESVCLGASTGAQGSCGPLSWMLCQ